MSNIRPQKEKMFGWILKTLYSKNNTKYLTNVLFMLATY